MKITKEDVGRRVWSFTLGWGIIIEVKSLDLEYPIKIHFDLGRIVHLYTEDGKHYEGERQTLFWDEIKFKEPPKPKRKVKKQIEYWANIYADGRRNIHNSENEAKNNSCFIEDVIRVKLTGEYEVEE